MEFRIIRASTWGDDDLPPCEGCRRVAKQCSNEDGSQTWENVDWMLDVDDILEFAKATNHRIVVNPGDPFIEVTPSLLIYDDYIE